MIALKHILVATDFGESSDHALAYACELARAFDAEIHLVHVAEELDADAKERLTRQSSGLACRTTPVVLTSDRTAAAILEYANKSRVDLIVAGTHGRSGFADLFMGSVAQEIVRMAGCPVMTLRSGPARSV